MSLETPLAVLSHPLTFLLGLNLASTLVLTLTSPTSIVRPGALGLMVAGFWYTLPTYLQRTGRVPWAAFLAGTTVTSILQYIEFALIRGWTYNGQGRELFIRKTPSNRACANVGVPWRQHLYFGYFITTSTRHIGTACEVKGVPDFSAGDPRYVPSRATFLFRRVLISFACFLFLDFAALGTRLHKPDPSLHSPQCIPVLARISDISQDEALTRVQDTIGYYIFCYCLIQCYTSIFACIVVGLGIDKVEYWRPNFDALGDAYNLRQFWGYAHKLFYLLT